jgi:hypothetical protein
MSFPLTVEAIKAIQANPPPAPESVTTTTTPDPSIRSTFIARRVQVLSQSVLSHIQNGLSSYVISGLMSENVFDISVGMKSNFPDSKVVADVSGCNILVDWTTLN